MLALEVGERVVPAAHAGQGAGAFGRQDAPQPPAYLSVVFYTVAAADVQSEAGPMPGLRASKALSE
ncbi:hypothetical protein GCM10022252_64990 [Streptosporangium oxazolinicum]|uniref:Uncharacterized protein n=1 Tax=Streptosporangium oxazolinicum TaxID=909287 RepID=A0ABP8BEK2_9ACTN